MAKEDKTKLDNIVNNEISLDDLNEISGGRIKVAGYGVLTALIAQMKALGKDKEYCIEVLKKGWDSDSPFKTMFTDQIDSDLQKAINFIDKTW